MLDHIRPDSDLIVQSANGEPVTVLDAIEAAAGRLERVRVHQALAAHDRPYHAGAFGARLRHISYFLTTKLRVVERQRPPRPHRPTAPHRRARSG